MTIASIIDLCLNICQSPCSFQCKHLEYICICDLSATHIPSFDVRHTFYLTLPISSPFFTPTICPEYRIRISNQLLSNYFFFHSKKNTTLRLCIVKWRNLFNLKLEFDWTWFNLSLLIKNQITTTEEHRTKMKKEKKPRKEANWKNENKANRFQKFIQLFKICCYFFFPSLPIFRFVWQAIKQVKKKKKKPRAKRQKKIPQNREQ